MDGSNELHQPAKRGILQADLAGLPEYAPLLAARHTAHRHELSATLDGLWGGQRLDVLDVACGDGFYAAVFDAVLGNGSRVVAIDLSSSFLAWAAELVRAERGRSAAVTFLKADAEQLPLRQGRFDLAWCAQSLISLPDPIAALAAMGRAVRPGGTVAVLENDRLHELQLPWPPALELALRNAENRADRLGDAPGKQNAGRFLEDRLVEAGLTPQRRVTLAVDRQAPLPAADEAFIQLYLHSLMERTAGLLNPAVSEELHRLATPGSAAYLPAQKSFWMTWTDVVVVSTRE